MLFIYVVSNGVLRHLQNLKLDLDGAFTMPDLMATSMLFFSRGECLPLANLLYILILGIIVNLCWLGKVSKVCIMGLKKCLSFCFHYVRDIIQWAFNGFLG